MRLPAPPIRRSSARARPGFSGLGLFNFPTSNPIPSEPLTLNIDWQAITAELQDAGAVANSDEMTAIQARNDADTAARDQVARFLSDAGLYLSDYPGYAARYPDRSNVGVQRKYIAEMERNGFVDLVRIGRESLTIMEALPAYFIQWSGGPLPDTDTGRDLYAATLKNLTPPSDIVASTFALRQWEIFTVFKHAAKPGNTWVQFNAAGLLMNGPGAFFYQVSAMVNAHADFWDIPGMFYPVNMTVKSAVKVWRSTMDQFYGQLPPPHSISAGPEYIEYFNSHNGRVAFGGYGALLNQLAKELPAEVKQTIAANKPPYYTAGESDNFFQLKSGRNLENAIIFSQWIMAGANPQTPPAYKKQLKPPSSGDQIKQVAIGFASFAMAFIGVPAVIGALNVVLQNVAAIYMQEKAEDVQAAQIAAEKERVEIAKQQAEINAQMEKINAEMAALESDAPVRIVGKKGGAVGLTILATIIGAFIL